MDNLPTEIKKTNRLLTIKSWMHAASPQLPLTRAAFEIYSESNSAKDVCERKNPFWGRTRSKEPACELCMQLLQCTFANKLRLGWLTSPFEMYLVKCRGGH